MSFLAEIIAQVPEVAKSFFDSDNVKGGLLLAFLGVAVAVMKMLADLRSGLAKEVGREMEAQAKPQQVNIQQPVVITGERQYVERETHQKLEDSVEVLRAEMKAGFTEMEKNAKMSRASIYSSIRNTETGLAANTEKTNLTYAQTQMISGQIERILQRLPRAHPQQ